MGENDMSEQLLCHEKFILLFLSLSLNTYSLFFFRLDLFDQSLCIRNISYETHHIV